MSAERIEEAVGQYLRISRMWQAGDLTEDQARRGLRALQASVRPEEWTAVKHEGFARQMRAAGWEVQS